jgi:hypothetical protein
VSAWLGWLIAFACVAIWLGVGFGVVAPRWITREIAAEAARYPSLVDRPGWLADQRREATGMCWGPALIWPFMFFTLLGKWANKRSRMSALERLKRIEQLEREAGIKP